MNNSKLFFSFFILRINFIDVGAVFNPKDNDFMSYETDRIDWEKHSCKRNCSEGEVKTCHYGFLVETYTTMSRACYNCPYNVSDCFRPHCLSADGRNKIISVANRLLPGPSIEVCEGDKIVADVTNGFKSATTTIHWHGLEQKESPYTDGVPYITQCPILPGQKFRYIFKASKAGTYFWHSHMGGQRANGLFGSLIIRRSTDPHQRFYDFDHHKMMIMDWKQQTVEDFMMTKNHYWLHITPHTLLVNGLGHYQNFTQNGKEAFTPRAIFNVERGFRYRFRIINAGAESCPIEISVDQHIMMVISADSNDIKPIEVDSLTMWPGERYDVVIRANQPIDNYWIRYRGHSLCTSGLIANHSEAFQTAILRYKTAPEINPVGLIGWNIPDLKSYKRMLNPYWLKKNDFNTAELRSISEQDITLMKEPDYRFYLRLDLQHTDNYDYHRKNLYGFNQVSKPGPTPQLNHITYTSPSIPLLSQRDELTPDMFCNSTSQVKNCTAEFCACTHLLQVKLNSVVELVLVDEALNGPRSQHPFHLHGHFFRVLALNKLDNNRSNIKLEEVMKLDQEGMIPRNLKNPPLKDTVRIPKAGYTILRFYADNPGYWLYHCHYEQHTEQGLALIFKVGEHEDMLPIPKGFPRCGSYLPEI